MKYGLLSKYIKEAGVGSTGSTEIMHFQNMPSLESMEGYSGDQFVEWLKKLIEWLKNTFSKIAEQVKNGTATLRTSIRDGLDSLGSLSDFKLVDFDIPGVLANSLFVNGHADSSRFKSILTRLQLDLSNSEKAIRGFRAGSDVDALSEATKQLHEDVGRSTISFGMTLGRLDDGETSTVTISWNDRNELRKILELCNKALDHTSPSLDGITRALKSVSDKTFEDSETLSTITWQCEDTLGYYKQLIQGYYRYLDSVVNSVTRLIKVIKTSGPSTESFIDEEIVYDEGAPAHVNAETETLGVDTQPDNALFKQLRTISTEALSIGNFARYFSRKADSLSIAVQEGFKYLTTYNYDPMETLHPMQMDNYVSTLDFMDHEDLKVPQPTSFKGELLPYTTLLLERAQTMNKVLTNVIQPATTRFGHYLSLPMDRAERRDFEYGINIQDDREKMVKEDAKLFGSNRSSSASLGELFNSFSDFVSAERNMLSVKATLGEGGMDQVKKAVQALTITAGALIRRLGEDTNHKPSTEFVRMISDQLTEVARWVEWYAGQMTRIIETNNALYEVEKSILKL